MEEPRSISGSEPTDRTTGKLPAENSSSNTDQAATNGNQQSQGPVIDNNLQLVVIEGFQVGRGVALDPVQRVEDDHPLLDRDVEFDEGTRRGRRSAKDAQMGFGHQCDSVEMS